LLERLVNPERIVLAVALEFCVLSCPDEQSMKGPPPTWAARALTKGRAFDLHSVGARKLCPDRSGSVRRRCPQPACGAVSLSKAMGASGEVGR
jgi:hypothetical protein